jgi:hypothetical protein
MLGHQRSTSAWMILIKIGEAHRNQLDKRVRELLKAMSPDYQEGTQAFPEKEAIRSGS